MSETMPPIQSATPVAQSSSRAWEVLCHLSSIAGLWVPCGNILGPLLIWLFKHSDSAGVDAHGKESLNFHISWALYEIAAWIVALLSIFVLIGLVMIPMLIVFSVIARAVMAVLVLIASVKASNGRLFRYPLTIRFLS